MTLTERLARPILQTETQVADMRKSMEELRQQCKHRVASLVDEVPHHPNPVYAHKYSSIRIIFICIAFVEIEFYVTSKYNFASKLVE